MGQCAGLSLAAGLAVALLGTAASRADDCDARCGSSYCGATDEASAWKCDDDRRSCIASCLNEQSNGGTTGGNSSGAARATQYGAIAYSAATGGYGFTYNYANDTGAQRDAVAYCEQDARNAGDCRVLVSFHNTQKITLLVHVHCTGREIGRLGAMTRCTDQHVLLVRRDRVSELIISLRTFHTNITISSKIQRVTTNSR